MPEDQPADDRELEIIEASLGTSRAGDASSTALAPRDPLTAYMNEVRRYPLLTREQERELAIKWLEENDREAGRKLVTSNLRLVVKIANEYRKGYQNLLDLVQEGNIGLVKAVQKFDPYRGVKLSTYAGWWIRAYILKYVLDTWRLVKIGTTQNQRKLFYNLRKQQDALRAAGIEPSAERLAEALDVSKAEVVEMQKRLAAPDLSLHAPVKGGEDGSRTGLDLLEDEVQDDPEQSVGNAEFKTLLGEKLAQFGSSLQDRDLEIFRERLMSDDPVSLNEFGSRWGVSRERARQIEKRLLGKLRVYLQEELGDAVEIALGEERQA